MQVGGGNKRKQQQQQQQQQQPVRFETSGQVTKINQRQFAQRIPASEIQEKAPRPARANRGNNAAGKNVNKVRFCLLVVGWDSLRLPQKKSRSMIIEYGSGMINYCQKTYLYFFLHTDPQFSNTCISAGFQTAASASAPCARDDDRRDLPAPAGHQQSPGPPEWRTPSSPAFSASEPEGTEQRRGPAAEVQQGLHHREVPGEVPGGQEGLLQVRGEPGMINTRLFLFRYVYLIYFSFRLELLAT